MSDIYFTPRNVLDLDKFFHTLFENRQYIASMHVNAVTHTLLFDLEVRSGGLPDHRIPIKSAMVEQAKELMSLLRADLDTGREPSRYLSERLLAMVNPRASGY